MVYRGEGKGHAHRRVWGPTDTLCSFTASVTRPPTVSLCRSVAGVTQGQQNTHCPQMPLWRKGYFELSQIRSKLSVPVFA